MRSTLACMATGLLSPIASHSTFARDLASKQPEDIPDQIPLEVMTNGLTPEHDFFFPEKPENPEMRESTSIWMYEENGNFGFPRIGIEAEAHSWNNKSYHANFALGNNVVMHGIGQGASPSVIGPDGKASVFGAGPVTFRCIEPFRRWLFRYEGTAYQGTLDEQIARTLHDNPQVPVTLEAELIMHTPAWVQNYTPDQVARMTPDELRDAQLMGLGWRFEHLFRGTGTLTVDGSSRDFRCLGSRIKRQSIRPLGAFRGHCWQSALFPDGRAFGFIAYPRTDTAEPFHIGYVYLNGKMYPAQPTKIPFIRQVLGGGDDVSLELESELGVHRIAGSTTLSTFRSTAIPGSESDLDTLGFTVHQGGARYTWDGMTSYGMIERSATKQQMIDGYDL